MELYIGLDQQGTAVAPGGAAVHMAHPPEDLQLGLGTVDVALPLLLDAADVPSAPLEEPVEPGGAADAVRNTGVDMALVGVDQSLDGDQSFFRVADLRQSPGLGKFRAPDVHEIRLFLLQNGGKIHIGAQQQVGGQRICLKADCLGIGPGGADGDVMSRIPDGIQSTVEPAAEDGGLLAQMHRQLRHHDIHKPEDLHAHSSFRRVIPT